MRAIYRGGGAFDNVADCLDADTSSIGTALSVPLASNEVIAELVATCSMKVPCTLVARLTSPVGHAFAYGGSGRTPAIVITKFTWPSKLSAVLSGETALANVALGASISILTRASSR